VEAGCGAEGALTRSERAELVELRRENRRLQMEREILKNVSGTSKCCLFDEKLGSS
jgi:transposase-like protein